MSTNTRPRILRQDIIDILAPLKELAAYAFAALAEQAPFTVC